MYYFRWWSFRKHLEQTPERICLHGISHAGPPRRVSSALGHHLMEGRWLHDQNYLDDYVRYWLRGDDGNRKQLHNYSSWLADALYQRYLVTGDKKFVIVAARRFGRAITSSGNRNGRLTNGLFWQFDVRDAMEESISGSRTNKNLRPTINSYMFAQRPGHRGHRAAGGKQSSREGI